MKTARIFLTGMYLQLILGILAPVSALLLGRDSSGVHPPAVLFLLCAYLAAAILTVLSGCLCAVMGFVASRQRHMGRLVMGWRTVKLKSIPFHVLNFVWSFVSWGLFILASHGVRMPLLLVPLCLSWLFIVQSGCLGVALLRTMRRHGQGPSPLHYLGQLLPGVDVISTLFLLRALQVDNIN